MSHSITVSNQLEEIAKVQSYLTEMVQDSDCQEGKADELCLIAEEVLVNIISHGYVPDKEDQIRIKFEQENGSFILEFHDQGTAFNPLEAEDRPEGKVGGWGIPLVIALSDHIEYKSDSGTNVLRVRVLKRDKAD